MGLITEEVEVRIHPSNIKRLEGLGYEIPTHIDKYGKKKYNIGDFITVKVKDLTHGSKAKVKVKCDGCGEILTVNYSTYIKFNRDGKYYCHACTMALFNSGENHPMWDSEKTDEDRELRRNIEGYDDFVQGVLERDDFLCQVCKDPSKRGTLVAHHLDGYNWCREKRTDVKNGICLCSDCHKKFHSLYGTGNNTKEQFFEWIGKVIELNDYEVIKYPERKVYCFETDTVYDSCDEASEILGIDRKAILEVCNLSYRRNTAYNHHFIYKDDFDKMSKEDIEMLKIKWDRGKKVICLNTQKVYDTIRSVKQDYPDIDIPGITECCRGNRTVCGKTEDGAFLNWMYYEDYLKADKDKIEIKEPPTNKRKVICVTTMKVFDSILEACEYYNFSCGTSISKACKSNFRISCGRLEDESRMYWLYYEDYLEDPDIVKELDKKKVVCLNTGKIYNDITSAKAAYPTEDLTMISECCKYKKNFCGRDENGEPLVWMYYNDYIEKGGKREYVNHGITKVVCLNTGKVYNSIRSVKLDYPSINTGAIGLCCKGITKHTGKDEVTGEKLRWVYYKDYIKQENDNN